MQDQLDHELERIDKLPKLGLLWVEYSAYALGVNIAPRKRSSKYCRLYGLTYYIKIVFVKLGSFLSRTRILVLIVNLSIIYSLVAFIMENYMISFETYVEVWFNVPYS